MATTTPAPPRTPRRAATEPRIAYATAAAPVVLGALTPFLNTDAQLALDLTYLAAAGITTANISDLIPRHLMHQLPAADILRAHRLPMFISTLTTGIAVGMGTFAGSQGTDALMAGVFQMASNPLPGIVSLAWWATVALVPYQLRRILLGRRRRKPPTRHLMVPPKPTAAPIPANIRDVLAKWGQYVSHPDTGAHKNQILRVTAIDDRRWKGIITAPTGSSVTVSKDTVSSVFGRPTDWIHLTPGTHSGEAHITVNLIPPPDLDPSTLEGAWRKWVAKTGGLMTGTHLNDIQDDPNTGGQVALVVAGDNLDRLKHPDRLDLAGALRTNPLLVSYEPRLNPREAVIRKMAHNPLQKGAAFPGLHVLRPNANGYIQIGPGVSGFPARIQLHDPALGGQHCIVAGVTGSGKGGTLQIIALAHHANRSAIIYADPKGSSNPAIEKMAAYSGCGLDESIGALRIWYHGLRHRVEQSRQLGMKNFQASPDMPWAPLIFDEASQLLGEKAEHRAEAKFIIKAGASLGRSLGMPVILANQIMQLDQLGGEAAIRDNIFYGGSLILLRSDSQQKTLIDLPENFAGCNPADIPPAWSGDRDMVYDPDKPLNDPERTFGLAFAASPGGHAEMMRMWILEDATPYIDPALIADPADWPFWDQRHELAQYSVLPDDQADDDGDIDDFGGGASLLAGINLAPKKPTSADDKILKVLRDMADPAGIDTNYTHRDTISQLAGVEGSTLSNSLAALTKAGKIHRQMRDGKEVRGYYGLGPTPALEQETTG
jgi:hypothetical protein